MTDHIILPRSVVEQAIEFTQFCWRDVAMNDYAEEQRSKTEAMLRAALAAEQAEPVAWRTFDGEGGYDYRSFEDNENYQSDFVERNGPNYASWVEPLYAAPQPAQPVVVPQGWVMPTEAEIDEYIEDYEMRGDGSDYRPTEQERFVIKDAIMGLLAESFKDSTAKLANQIKEST